MKISQALHAWATILAGRAPSLSIEITKECPLRCPGCYAFDTSHLGPGQQLRQLSDFKGDELVRRVLALVDRYKPLHLSIVGGDPLVRYRELDALIPQLNARRIYTQIVTSAFRVVPKEWFRFDRFYVAVSVDGLAPEHDVRRKPATYERILKNIAEAHVFIHCTITSQIASREGYLEEFIRFWSARPEVIKIWFSLFTPQRGATDPEILTFEQRDAVIAELLRLRRIYPDLQMDEPTLREFASPPQNPKDCIFARTTATISADLTTKITPCQFGGDPDCSRCGCMASMGLAAVGHYHLGPLTVGHIFKASGSIGKAWNSLSSRFQTKPALPPEVPFNIL
jgi:MoaA/NifB/PqqE/SkfB family radical SAM enzyme